MNDLAKLFECLSHDVNIAKLIVYGLSLPGLKLNSYHSWEKTLFGIPQRSILGPIVFYIFLIDLFILEDVNIANYAIIIHFTVIPVILIMSLYPFNI